MTLFCTFCGGVCDYIPYSFRDDNPECDAYCSEHCQQTALASERDMVNYIRHTQAARQIARDAYAERKDDLRFIDDLNDDELERARVKAVNDMKSIMTSKDRRGN